MPSPTRKPTSSRADGAPDARSHADRVYAGLRERLLRGELPADRRLVEEQVAGWFRTSRTPVREALRRLEGDGHLIRGETAGYRPTAPDMAAMDDLYEVRIAMEDVVVRRAAGVGDAAVLRGLREDWRTLAVDDGRSDGPDPGFVHADERFHHRLALASGNLVALRVLDDVAARIRVLRIHDFMLAGRVRDTVSEHLEILEAVLEGDAEAAAAFMRGHVLRSRRVARELADQAARGALAEAPASDPHVETTRPTLETP